MMKSLTIALTLLSSLHVNASTMCNRTAHTIAEIQGASHKSPYLDQKVTFEGVVVGDFQGAEALGGFFVQSLQADNNPKTSEGIFVHHSKTDVSVGNHVVVHGEVSERHEMTQIHSALIGDVCAEQVDLPEAVAVNLPLPSHDLEHLEGMRVTLPQQLTVTDVYHFAKHGEFTLSSGRLFSPTQLVMPGKAAQKMKADNALNQIIIDDGRNAQFLPQYIKVDHLESKFNASKPLRLGYQAKGVTGILNFAFDRYKLQLTERPQLTAASSLRKPTVKDTAGQLKIATFNIENFFHSIDQGKENCGPQKSWGCRGADSSKEFKRQLNKIVSVIHQSGADVVALQELENDDRASTEALVMALNKIQNNSWSYIHTGPLANDVIKVGLIYKNQVVKVLGSHAVLDDKSLPDFKVHRHRPIVLQAFESQSGQRFQLASIHLKSKSCREAKGKDKAQGDGQGCYAGERALATKQLTAWLKTDPLGLGIENTVLAGDFNSYGREDAIRVLEAAGFTDLARHFIGDQNWTTSYRGHIGALDHILVNQSALAQTKAAVQWHINSDEFHEFAYDLEDLDKGVKKPKNFYSNGPFSSSDHDLVMAGFDF